MGDEAKDTRYGDICSGGPVNGLNHRKPINILTHATDINQITYAMNKLLEEVDACLLTNCPSIYSSAEPLCFCY